MYQFPDAEMGLARLLDGMTVTQGGRTFGPTTTFLQLTVDFALSLPAVLVFRTGGVESGAQRMDRVEVQVYAVGTDSAGIGEGICAFLADVSHYVPGVGLLDDVQVDSVPHGVPYQDDRITLNAASYRVFSRPL